MVASVWRVVVGFGGRPRPREFLVRASSLVEAARTGARAARAARLARPHVVEAVFYVGEVLR